MTCSVCGKGRQRGHRVSHAKNRSIRFFKPNLHKWQGKMLCTRCLKKAKKPQSLRATPTRGRGSVATYSAIAGKVK